MLCLFLQFRDQRSFTEVPIGVGIPTWLRHRLDSVGSVLSVSSFPSDFSPGESVDDSRWWSDRKLVGVHCGLGWPSASCRYRSVASHSRQHPSIGWLRLHGKFACCRSASLVAALCTWDIFSYDTLFHQGCIVHQQDTAKYLRFMSLAVDIYPQRPCSDGLTYIQTCEMSHRTMLQSCCDATFSKTELAYC